MQEVGGLGCALGLEQIDEDAMCLGAGTVCEVAQVAFQAQVERATAAFLVSVAICVLRSFMRAPEKSDVGLR